MRLSVVIVFPRHAVRCDRFTRVRSELTAPVETLSRIDPGLVEETQRAIEESRAPATIRAYKSDLRRFQGWCASRGQNSRPASPAVVALYLTDMARRGRRIATIERACAAIAYAHELAGFPSPRSSPLVQKAIAGLRRRLGVAPVQKRALEVEPLIEVIRAMPKDLVGLRDRAILLVGFGGAFRRSELVSLLVEDLRYTPDGVAVTLRRSKTDQEGHSRVVPICKGRQDETCPVQALRAWLAASGVRSGAVFRSISRWEKVSAKALSAQTVARIVKRAVKRVGLDARQFAGHSLRAGFVTSAALTGARELAIQRVTGHRSLEVLSRYVRAAEAFEAHPGAQLKL